MKKETNKITTKLLKEMKPGEAKLFKGSDLRNDALCAFAHLSGEQTARH